MSHELPLRITVIKPPRGVAWAVQSGRSELIEPGERTEALIGQADSCWDRKAKVPLTGIPRELIESVRRNPGARLEARILGTWSDGRPACATVPLLKGGWRVIAPAAA